MPGRAACHVWLRPTVPGAPPPLGEAERSRWERLASAPERDRTATAHHLLREAAAWWSGTDPQDVVMQRRCARCGGTDHGRVEVVGVASSVSHSGGLVAVALCPGRERRRTSWPWQVGVDVEALPQEAPDVTELVLSPRERREHASIAPSRRGQDLIVRWVRKEAVLKATGFGLSVDPARLEVSDPQRRARVRRWVSSDRPPGSATIALADLHTPAGYLGAVAVVGARRLLVRTHP